MGILQNFTRRSFLAGIALCPACVGAADPPSWNYEAAGPSKWADLDPSFQVCGAGDQQSPVDLHDGIRASLPPLHLNWKSGEFRIVNTGHTIQVNAGAGNSLAAGAAVFELAQFHFHSPSEHAVNGIHAAMEAHFVHRQADGRIAVLAVLLASGGHNETFSAIMNAAPARPDAPAARPLTLDPHHLLPASLHPTWRYEGSLTTPPCSQTVDWIIFEHTVSVPASDIEAFQRIFPMNARPVQPLDRRYLLRS